MLRGFREIRTGGKGKKGKREKGIVFFLGSSFHNSWWLRRLGGQGAALDILRLCFLRGGGGKKHPAAFVGKKV
jgi:hypothetical protein